MCVRQGCYGSWYALRWHRGVVTLKLMIMHPIMNAAEARSRAQANSLPVDSALAVGPVAPHVADEVGKRATLRARTGNTYVNPLLPLLH